MAGVGSKPGERRGGRQKGTPNKATASIKAAVLEVYERLQAAAGGDHAHFLKWANDAPTEFYKIAAKLIPQDMNVDARLIDDRAEALDAARRRISE